MKILAACLLAVSLAGCGFVEGAARGFSDESRRQAPELAAEAAGPLVSDIEARVSDKLGPQISEAVAGAVSKGIESLVAKIPPPAPAPPPDTDPLGYGVGTLVALWVANGTRGLIRNAQEKRKSKS